MPNHRIDQPPSTASHITHVCTALGLSAEAWPVLFWQQRSDGAMLEDQVQIYAAADIEERNHTYEVARYFPGWVAVGDDSGGRLLLAARQGGEGLWLVDAGAGTLDWADWFEHLDQLLESVREGR